MHISLRKKEFWGLIFPPLAALAVLVFIFFYLLLPSFEASLVAQKKETIRDLTRSAAHILEYYENKSKNGELSREEAQHKAMEEVRALRYGPENRDYFWINDMRPFMVMHPYRPDLEGKNIADLKDPHGVLLFKEFVEATKENGTGYVSYSWQWKDDSTRIVPKLSYVQRFPPWQWIIGTGIYLEDVRKEISLITQKLTVLFSLIFTVVVLSSGYVIRQGLQEATRKRLAEKTLQNHLEQLETTVALRTDELTKTNALLHEEIAEKHAAEAELHDQAGKLAAQHHELEIVHQNLKQTQSQMLQHEKMASIGVLAAGVAHEINNPTGYIISNLGTLNKYFDRLTDFIAAQASLLAATGQDETLAELRRSIKLEHVMTDGRDLIRESLDGAQRIKEIVQNLKNFSRLQEAGDQLANINECLENTIKIVWNELKYKLTLEKAFGDLPPTMCRAQELNQVFMNLLVNAAQAVENQGHVTVKTWEEGDWINVTIQDTGRGIAAEDLTKIFDPFFTTKEIGKGTGLGLSISYDIIKKHQGTISVTSELGKGATFHVRLPVKI